MTALKFAAALTTALVVPLSPALAQAPVSADWPSYNRTLTSERFSPLTALNRSNAAGIAEVCRFDTGETTAFQSGLVQVDGALFATTEHDTLSINPDDCTLNWRAHEAFPDSYLGAQRGVAVADGRVFRGARNGHVYAYDSKTGARLWDTEIADAAKGESAPSAPIAWQTGRRDGINSTAMVRAPAAFNKFVTSKPTSPCPITITWSPSCGPSCRTACSAIAASVVYAACQLSTPAGTGAASKSGSARNSA